MNTSVPSDSMEATAVAALRSGDVDRAVRLLGDHLADVSCAVALREWAVLERRMDLLGTAQAALGQASGDERIVSAAVAEQLRGNPAGAVSLLSAVSAESAAAASAAHHLGRALQNLGRADEAEASVRRALSLREDYPEARYSLGHILRASGRLIDALRAYQDVRRQRPKSLAVLFNLGVTLSAMDRSEAALEPLTTLLELDPEHVEARLCRGLCRQVLGQIPAARDDYRVALQLQPDHPLAHFYLGCLYNEMMLTDQAREHLRRALDLSPDDPEIIAEWVGMLEQTSELDSAAADIARGLAVAPGHPLLQLEAARIERRQGGLARARSRLLAIDAETLKPRPAVQYWFERALVHDQSNESADAMAALDRANALAMKNPRRAEIDRSAFPLRCETVRRWIREGAPGLRPAASDPPVDLPFQPAFLVGFPRSGTTLMDTMLDAHPGVASIEERATLERVVDEVLDPLGGYPKALSALQPDRIQQARSVYAQAAAAHLPRHFAGRVLDKLPLRVLRAPLIARLFPDAPIVFAVRHPCDVVLSNVMQQYVPNEAFIHFDTIEHAARIYTQVMSLWREILPHLPTAPHWLRYESLIERPEEELAATCAALGIELHPDMLDPVRRLAERGRVQTNSYQQVAEPLYRRAVGRWRRYRQWIDPVLPLLEPHIEWLGYPAPD